VPEAPRISVVLVTDQYRTIRRVLACLSSQTARSEIELVIVLPAASRDATAESALQGFASVRYVELASILPIPAARAAGIRAASAPIVFLGETHSFPDPRLAELLIAAHDGSWDAVVPGLSNANPQTVLSWASFLMDYGLWHEALDAGQIRGGPTWNVAYQRSLLMEIDSRLEQAMSHGDELAVWLHKRGARTYFEPRAGLGHANLERFRHWAEQRYLCGLIVASTRRRRWGMGRRLAYIAASPLIVAVMLNRIRPTVRRLRARKVIPVKVIPAVILGTLFRVAGEVVGYSRGARPQDQPRLDHFEIHKLGFLSMTQ
jgi:hypothetical protein